MNKSALVIGANGGIAQAIILQLLESDEFAIVYGVSRNTSGIKHKKYRHLICAQTQEGDIASAIADIPANSLDLAVCCIGTLQSEKRLIEPEKKLEDLQQDQLVRYFTINSVLPALWLRALESRMLKSAPSHLVFLSARVGSTGDNRLGGWYGYRASKAALNSLVKTAQVEYRRRKPKCTLVLYHPGTVDTNLSKPFQKNVPKEKLFTAAFTAEQLLNHLPNLENDNAPHYIDWQGKRIPW
ncbi:MAG: SDR family NAD(P)-dependent oxidoreductase [Aestuariibacter sp.]